MPDPNEEPPPPVPLPYRSIESDRQAHRNARAGGGSVGLGCFVSFACLLILLALTTARLSGSYYTPITAAWILTGPALLLTGGGLGIYYRNWGFFVGALISVLIVVGVIGFIMAICR